MMMNRRKWLGGAAALLAGSALDLIGPELAKKAFWDNPLALYRVKATVAGWA